MYVGLIQALFVSVYFFPLNSTNSPGFVVGHGRKSLILVTFLGCHEVLRGIIERQLQIMNSNQRNYICTVK